MTDEQINPDDFPPAVLPKHEDFGEPVLSDKTSRLLHEAIAKQTGIPGPGGIGETGKPGIPADITTQAAMEKFGKKDGAPLDLVYLQEILGHLLTVVARLESLPQNIAQAMEAR